MQYNQASKKLEIVAPVGNFEKLKVACLYGADAVYLALDKYSLRYGASNFTINELKKAGEFCKLNNVKLYIALNIFPLESDLQKLPEILQEIKNFNITSAICSDIAIISLVKKYTNFNIHLSTQSSSFSSDQVFLFKDFGIKRVVLGREITIENAAKIKELTSLEIELFIHGAMCSAVSGNCVLSNYQNGRDSNRGGCIQNCRFEYEIFESKEKLALGSKDLNGMALIDQFKKYQIDAAKIEGRMKSSLYLATVVKAYRQAADNNKTYQNSLADLHNRDYWTGFLNGSSGLESWHNSQNFNPQNYAGIILQLDENKNRILFKCVNKINLNDEIEFILPSNTNIKINIDSITAVTGEKLPSASSARSVWINVDEDAIKKLAINLIANFKVKSNLKLELPNEVET